MSIVDRGPRRDRPPRSRWPEKPGERPRSRAPEPPQPLRSAPSMVTLALAALCIAVFAYGYFARMEDQLIRDYAYRPVLLQFPDTELYIRLVAHMFLHDGWVHLLVNMLVLYTFGRGLEPVLGSVRFLALYLVTGILSAIGQGLLTDSAQTQLVGASGAISGIIGAAVVAAPRLPVLFFIFPMPLFIAVILLVALHVAAIVFQWEPDIAWHAHLVGLAAGALLYPLLRRRHAA